MLNCWHGHRFLANWTLAFLPSWDMEWKQQVEKNKISEPESLRPWPVTLSAPSNNRNMWTHNVHHSNRSLCTILQQKSVYNSPSFMCQVFETASGSTDDFKTDSFSLLCFQNYMEKTLVLQHKSSKYTIWCFQMSWRWNLNTSFAVERIFGLVNTTREWKFNLIILPRT